MNTMTEDMETFRLWLRERHCDVFVEYEDDDDGEGKLLRYSAAETTEKRDFRCYLHVRV